MGMKLNAPNALCKQCGGNGVVVEPIVIRVDNKAIAHVAIMSIDDKCHNAKVIPCDACAGRNDVVGMVRKGRCRNRHASEASD
jgi:hypothetical protein